MHVLYLTRRWCGHDDRFVAAWRASGAEVTTLASDGGAPGQHAVPGSFEEQVAAATAADRPDVVHAGPVTDVAWTAAHFWDGALIATSWGFDLMDEVDRLPEAADRARAVLTRAEVVHVDNEGPARRAVALGAPADRLLRMPWGVDLERFTPGPPTPRHADRRVVLCTRRHEPIYEVDVVVRAFLAAAPVAPLLRLELAGSGSLTPDLADLVAASGLGDRVTFLGELDGQALVDAYRRADLYVSASSVDGTSVSLLEAMASGTPVCVSAIPGNAEWVTADTGVDFPVGDVDALAEHLVRAGTPGTADEAWRARAGAALDLVQRRADWRRAPATLVRAADLARARQEERA